MICASFALLKPAVQRLMWTPAGCFVILSGDCLTPEIHFRILLIAIEGGIHIQLALIFGKVKHIHAQRISIVLIVGICADNEAGAVHDTRDIESICMWSSIKLTASILTTYNIGDVCTIAVSASSLLVI